MSNTNETITVPRASFLSFLGRLAQSKDPEVRSAAKQFKSELQQPKQAPKQN